MHTASVLIFTVSAAASWFLNLPILFTLYCLGALWLAGLHPKVHRVFYRLKHRKCCGKQTFHIVRRECITVHHIEGPGWALDIPVYDLRIRCPRCGRVHRISRPGESTFHREVE